MKEIRVVSRRTQSILKSETNNLIEEQLNWNTAQSIEQVKSLMLCVAMVVSKEEVLKHVLQFLSMIDWNTILRLDMLYEVRKASNPSSSLSQSIALRNLISEYLD